MTDDASQDGLRAVSLLFSYPDASWSAMPIPQGLAKEARAVFEEMRGYDRATLESEYIRLFVNSMPEVPCPPYGSVYLEGTVMGESTLKVAAIYRHYGLAPQEVADHLAVEAEFLAWLHGRIDTTGEDRERFEFLLGHLRHWTAEFFASVERHDRLGCYRQAALAAKRILEHID